MARIRSLIVLVGGLTMAWSGALQDAAAGPVPAVLSGPEKLADGVAGSVSSGKRSLFGSFHGAGNGISLPVNARMSFSLGYQYLTEEDLVFEVAETGSLAAGYDSHRVMVRARWRF